MVGTPRENPGLITCTDTIPITTKTLATKENMPILCRSSSGLFEKEAKPRSAIAGDPIVRLYFVLPDLRSGRL